MKTLSKREKVMLLILGIVLIAYLYYSLFYIPIQNKIEASKLNTNKYIQDINAAKLSKKQFELQTSELENIKAKYEEAKTILPQMEMNPEIVYNIQKFFQGSGVEVTSITIGAPEEFQNQVVNAETKGDNQNNSFSNSNSNSTNENPTIQKGTGKLLTVPVTIVLSGDNYEEVMKFISLFENDRRFVEITNIVITANRPIPQTVPQTQTVPQSTAKPTAVEKQADNNEIQVLVVGEGEEYKEIPAAGAAGNVTDAAKQETAAKQSKQSDINLEDSKPKIEVNISARYYYIDSNTNEQPSYDFKNGVNGKKDLFK